MVFNVKKVWIVMFLALAHSSAWAQYPAHVKFLSYNLWGYRNAETPGGYDALAHVLLCASAKSIKTQVFCALDTIGFLQLTTNNQQPELAISCVCIPVPSRFPCRRDSVLDLSGRSR